MGEDFIVSGPYKQQNGTEQKLLIFIKILAFPFSRRGWLHRYACLVHDKPFCVSALMFL